jgi:hypothetical protein
MQKYIKLQEVHKFPSTKISLKSGLALIHSNFLKKIKQLQKLVGMKKVKHAGLVRKNIRKHHLVWELATPKQIKHAATLSKMQALDQSLVRSFLNHAKETTQNCPSFNALDAWVMQEILPLRLMQQKAILKPSMNSWVYKKLKPRLIDHSNKILNALLFLKDMLKKVVMQTN